MSSSGTMSPAATQTPALTPPPNVHSNWQNPDSLRSMSYIVTGISVPIVTIFFAARCYVRIIVKRSWIIEDWLALLGWIGTVAYCGVLVTLMTHHGGEHGWDITGTEAQESAYWVNVAQIEYGVTICFTKIAILQLYRRVFSSKRWSKFDLTIFILTIILILFYTGLTLAKIFQCTPRSKITNSEIPGSCVNLSALLNASGSFNTVSDFIILFLPVQAVWNLKMKRSKKIIVCLVFTFGSCAPIFSVVGFVVRIQVSALQDKTWNQPIILLWAAAELTTGFLCACFAEMGALFRPRRRNRSQYDGQGSQYGSRSGAASGLRSPRLEPKRPTRVRGLYGEDSSDRDSDHDQLYVPLYDVHVAQVAGPPVPRGLDAVHVKRDVTVELYHAL